MTPEEYKQYARLYPDVLGCLVANLAALEVALRIALYLIVTPAAERRPHEQKLSDLAIGELLPESHITSWATLGELIKDYNDRHREVGPAGHIDPTIKDLRDGLAHGRILAGTEFGYATLIRFAKPRHGRVLVEDKQVMTIEWINSQLARVYAATDVIRLRIHELARAG